MKTQNATYYHLILDKSGSMSSHYDQTLSGLNEKLISIKNIQQRNPEIPVFLSLTLFSDRPELIFEDLPAQELREITSADYVLDGMTGLLDAVGTVIERVEFLHGKDIRDKNANAMIVIFTDGMENASRRFTNKEIAERIRLLESTGKWAFAFVGADIDAWDAARQMNFEQNKVYSSRKSQVKETMAYLAEQLENSIELKKQGKNWDGFK